MVLRRLRESPSPPANDQDSTPSSSSDRQAVEDVLTTVAASSSSKRTLADSPPDTPTEPKRPKSSRGKGKASNDEELDLADLTFKEWELVDPDLVPKAADIVCCGFSSLHIVPNDAYRYAWCAYSMDGKRNVSQHGIPTKTRRRTKILSRVCHATATSVPAASGRRTLASCSGR